MVLLSYLVEPFVCGWHYKVVRCLMQGSVHTSARNLLTKCVLLPVGIYVGVSYDMSQCYWLIS